MRAILGTFLVIGLIGGGTARGESSPARYDGKELYRGLFLAEGPVARAHPELSLHQGQPWTTAEADDLTARIEALEPGFFDGFAAGITSGDRVRIAQSADAAYGRTVEATSAVAPGKGVHGSFIVVHRTVVKATHMVVNKHSYWHRASSRSAALVRERWADDVAETLTP
ncbi:hypothetical protein [Nonomuraea indica]|uniref:hypothetical protein n=1 Tax=Nonomuraea indica TaxID=1581193 RepID=UPI000C7B4F9E|nr:hypothetical protein [Nonomuraea indica]